jgi:iron complex transport system ATP-binding protein
MKTVLSCNNLHFNYGKKKVLGGIDLELKEGEILSLLGPNGTGKSTLMKIILGLLKPQDGHVAVYGKALGRYGAKERAKTVAYVPQSSNVAFAFSALDVVMMGRVSHGSIFSNPTKTDREKAVEAMDRLGIASLANRDYPTMSGGEKQLTLIARVLAQGAKILIMDEPISGLDYGNQLLLLETIISLSKEGYSFLKSTHFPEHAMIIGGRTIAIKNGSVIADGDSANVISPELIGILYGAKVDIKSTECGYPVCVPSFFGNKFAYTK